MRWHAETKKPTHLLTITPTVTNINSTRSPCMAKHGRKHFSSSRDIISAAIETADPNAINVHQFRFLLIISSFVLNLGTLHLSQDSISSCALINIRHISYSTLSTIIFRLISHLVFLTPRTLPNHLIISLMRFCTTFTSKSYIKILSNFTRDTFSSPPNTYGRRR